MLKFIGWVVAIIFCTALAVWGATSMSSDGRTGFGFAMGLGLFAWVVIDKIQELGRKIDASREEIARLSTLFDDSPRR